MNTVTRTTRIEEMSTTERANADNRTAAIESSNPMPHTSSEVLVVHRFMVEVLGTGDVTQLTELVAPDYVGHFWNGDHYGPEGLRIDASSYWKAFPDLTLRLEHLFACGEYVVRHFTIQGTHVGTFLDRPPTGETVMLRGIGIDHVVSEQLQESWVMVEIAPRAPPTDW